MIGTDRLFCDGNSDDELFDEFFDELSDKL